MFSERVSVLLLAAGLLTSCAPVAAPNAPTLTPHDTVTDAPATVAPTSPAPTTGNGVIAFVVPDAFGNFVALNLLTVGEKAQPVNVDAANPNTQTSCYPAPLWSPNGRYLVVSRRAGADAPKTELVIVDTQQNNAITLIPQTGFAMAWAPDSTRLYHTHPLEWDLGAANKDEGLWAWDLATNQDVQIFKPFEEYPLGNIGLAPDGTRLSMHMAVFEGTGPFALANVDGSNVKLFEIPVGNYDWSPDSQWLAFDQVTYIPQPPSSLMLIDRNGEQQTVLYEAPEDVVALDPQWSPDGQTIAFIQSTGIMVSTPQASIWLIGADGTKPRELPIPGLTEAQWFDWAPDGQSLVVAGREGMYWVPLKGEPTALGAGGCPMWRP